MSPVRRRLAISLVVLAQVVAACGSSGTPSPTPAPTGPSPDPSTAVSPVATPGPSVTPSPTPAPTPTPTATPEPTPSPTPTPAPTAPTAKAFWARVVDAVKERGRLRIRVIGPSPGELRYQTDASATAMNGEVVFVCVGDRAWDGQAGFDRLPGKWACGANALVAGFRTTGAPLDAWSVEIPQDEDVDEKVSLDPDGSWRWRYTATSPTVGGEVRATVVVDPATGQILSASRSDPTGETTYGISYTDPFPPITPP